MADPKYDLRNATPEERQSAFVDMMEIALNAVITL